MLDKLLALYCILRGIPPADSHEELHQQLMVLRLAVYVTMAVVVGAVGLIWLWANVPAAAVAIIALLVVWFFVAVWRSRKRHLAYEAMLAAERQKEAQR